MAYPHDLVEAQILRTKFMKPVMQVALLIFLTSATSFAAAKWSGQLVDSNCYESAKNNANPTEAQGSTTRNMSLIIRRCAPTANTKSFGLVHQDWQMSKLDGDGNHKAVGFIQNAGKREVYFVTITGKWRRTSSRWIRSRQENRISRSRLRHGPPPLILVILLSSRSVTALQDLEGGTGDRDK